MMTMEERKADYLLWLEEVMAMQPALREELAKEFVKRLEAMLTVIGDNLLEERKRFQAEIEDKMRVAVAWMNLCHQAEAKLKAYESTGAGKDSIVYRSPEHIYADVPCECHLKGFCPRHTARGAASIVHFAAEDTTVFQCDKCWSVFTATQDPCPFCGNKNFIPGSRKDFGITIGEINR